MTIFLKGLWSVNSRQTLVVLYFFHTIHYVICYTTAHKQNEENNREVPNIPSISSRTWNIAPNDKNVALYSSLIDILAKLEVLEVEENSSACITLDKIVREQERLENGANSKRVTVQFHFIETLHSFAKSELAQDVSSLPDIKRPAYSIGGLQAFGCNTSSSLSAQGLDSLSRKQETESSAKSVLEVASDVSNKTGDYTKDKAGKQYEDIPVETTCKFKKEKHTKGITWIRK